MRQAVQETAACTYKSAAAFADNLLQTGSSIFFQGVVRLVQDDREDVISSRARTRPPSTVKFSRGMSSMKRGKDSYRPCKAERPDAGILEESLAEGGHGHDPRYESQQLSYEMEVNSDQGRIDARDSRRGFEPLNSVRTLAFEDATVDGVTAKAADPASADLTLTASAAAPH